MNEPSEHFVSFSFANYVFQLKIDNVDLQNIYAEKLTVCLNKLQIYLTRFKQPRIDDYIYFGLAQGLIKRFDDLVNSLGERTGISPILDDITGNYLQAAMIGISRITTDWEIVCKIAFKD